MKPNKMLAAIVAATMTLAAVSVAVLAATSENPAECDHSGEKAAVAAVPATCTTDGKEAGEKCAVCGTVTKEGDVIPATGHSWGTAGEDGKIKCTECNAEKPADPNPNPPPETEPEPEPDPVVTTPPASSETEASSEETTVSEEETTTTASEETTTTAAAAEAVVYTPPASSDSSSPEAAEHIVESPKDVAASRKPDLTVNAAESGVSADIVTAFANNKSAKTLTLKYSSTLKVAIAKADINDAAAKLDFSVSGKKFLNTKTIQKNKALNNATKIVQLDFVSEGKLEGVDKATIKSNVGVALTGSKVTVYEYVDGKLVKVGVASVNGAGIVKFDIDHFGQFVLAVE